MAPSRSHHICLRFLEGFYITYTTHTSLFRLINFQINASRRMPTHIREFNRLEQHLSHDLVFKLVNQFSRGTTGILILRNIKFKILPSINPSLSDFTGFFALKTNSKIAIFVRIFTCVDFRGKITTKVCRNRERYHLISWHLSSAFKTTAVF